MFRGRCLNSCLDSKLIHYISRQAYSQKSPEIISRPFNWFKLSGSSRANLTTASLNQRNLTSFQDQSLARNQLRFISSLSNTALDSSYPPGKKQVSFYDQERNLQVRRKISKVQVTELEPKFNMEWPKILFFGDSITRRANDVDEGCWGSIIESQVNHYFDVDYRGFEGYNTRWALELMPKLFSKEYLKKVEIVVPFFGHNDSWDPKNPLSVPLDEFEKNLREMIKFFQDNGVDKSKIILVTPTWFHQDSFIDFLKSIGMPPSGKTYKDAEDYAEAVIRIATDLDIEYLDMFDISSEFEPLEYFFVDGVHYSKRGAEIMADNLFQLIQRKLETQFQKPLKDLCHAVPWDQRPEVVPVFKSFLDAAKKHPMADD